MTKPRRERLLRDIEILRLSIRQDWADMAQSSLTAEERAGIARHIQLCIEELHALAPGRDQKLLNDNVGLGSGRRVWSFSHKHWATLRSVPLRQCPRVPLGRGHGTAERGTERQLPLGKVTLRHSEPAAWASLGWIV